MHGPPHVLQVAVIEECVAVHLHPHPDLLDADRPDLRDGVAGEEAISKHGSKK